MIPPEAMPFKTGLIFTYDCGEFAKNLDLALDLADFAGFEARRAEARAPRQAARHRPLQHDRARRRAAASRRPRSASTAAARRPCCPARSPRGMGHETIYKQLMCDRLGIDPDQVQYIQGDTDKVAIGEGSGGSRSATLGGSAVYLATEKIVAKAKAIAAHLLERRARRRRVRRRRLHRSPAPNRALSLAEIAAEAWDPTSLPDGMEPGLVASAAYSRQGAELPQRRAISAKSRSTPRPATVEILRYSVVDDVGTVLNPLLLEGQIAGGIVQGVGQILMEDIHFDAGSGQLLTGSFMDYAMPRAGDLSPFHCESNPVPTKTNPLGRQGRGRSRRGRRDAGGRQCAGRRAEPLGIREVPMPATPERLWRAIREARRDRQRDGWLGPDLRRTD